MSRLPRKAFTLIELLIVIAIISILSTVALASLSTSRGKAQDSAVKTNAHQLARVLELEFSESGNYGAFLNNMIFNQAGVTPCITGAGGLGQATGNYAGQALKICQAILDEGSHVRVGHGLGGGPTGTQKYSITVYLPGKGTYFCLGSNGKSSDTSTTTTTSSPGCWADPTL